MLDKKMFSLEESCIISEEINNLPEIIDLTEEEEIKIIFGQSLISSRKDWIKIKENLSVFLSEKALEKLPCIRKKYLNREYAKNHSQKRKNKYDEIKEENTNLRKRIKYLEERIQYLEK